MVSKRIAGILLLLVLASVALSAGEAPVPQVEPPAQQGVAAPAPEVLPGQVLPVEAAPWKEALPPLSILDSASYTACTCTTQCGQCPSRLRGCYNGIPICECFHC